MHKTIDELGDALGDGEFQQWEAFAHVWGLPDSWLQTGQICAAFRGGKALDYIPRNPSKTMTAKGMEDLLNEVIRRNS